MQAVQNSFFNQALKHKQVSIKLEACSKHTKYFAKGHKFKDNLFFLDISLSWKYNENSF